MLPLAPPFLGWIASRFFGGSDSFLKYAAEVVQDGQLCFYSVAVGAAEVIELWEWHKPAVPYRGTLLGLMCCLIGMSLFFYTIFAALKEAKKNAANMVVPGGTVVKISWAMALSSAISVSVAHIWVKQHGG